MDLAVVPLVLVFCVPALLWFANHWALVADVGGVVLERGRGYPIRITAAIVGGVLAGVVLLACVGRAQELLPEDPSGALSGGDRVPPQEARMVRWMEENVPEGERFHLIVHRLTCLLKRTVRASPGVWLISTLLTPSHTFLFRSSVHEGDYTPFSAVLHVSPAQLSSSSSVDWRSLSSVGDALA